jgi:hypothetical protein
MWSERRGVIFQVTPRVEIAFYFRTTMSDLDADLYGGEFNAFASGGTNSHRPDLYGNDGAEEQPQEENVTQQQQPAPEAPAESSPNGALSSEHIQQQAPQKIPTYDEPTNGALSSQHIQQQAPQKIPTYEEPQPSEYREPQQIRSDGVYQNIPVNERSVRPSEMKDEG